MLKFDRWVNRCLHWIWISCRLFGVVISTSLSQNTSAVLVTLFRSQREPQMTCEIVCVSAFFPNIHVQTWEESCWISDIFSPVAQCCNRHPNIILQLIKSHQSLSARILFSLLYPIPPPPSTHRHTHTAPTRSEGNTGVGYKNTSSCSYTHINSSGVCVHVPAHVCLSML